MAGMFFASYHEVLSHYKRKIHVMHKGMIFLNKKNRFIAKQSAEASDEIITAALPFSIIVKNEGFAETKRLMMKRTLFQLT